ncbi:hypothetical protein BGX23_003598, partial [Mortierella sp. AD031]
KRYTLKFYTTLALGLCLTISKFPTSCDAAPPKIPICEACTNMYNACRGKPGANLSICASDYQGLPCGTVSEIASVEINIEYKRMSAVNTGRFLPPEIIVLKNSDPGAVALFVERVMAEETLRPSMPEVLARILREDFLRVTSEVEEEQDATADTTKVVAVEATEAIEVVAAATEGVITAETTELQVNVVDTTAAEEKEAIQLAKKEEAQEFHDGEEDGSVEDALSDDNDEDVEGVHAV